MNQQPDTLKTQHSVTRGASSLRRYQTVLVGSSGILRTLYYEWCCWLGPIPGGVGLALRKIFWPRLFGRCGSGVMFGANIILRHPHRITLGDNVVLSEGVLLDARHSESDNVIHIGDDVILSNSTMVSCKEGSVRIGRRVGIGAFTIIQSAQHCPVVIGEAAHHLGRAGAELVKGSGTFSNGVFSQVTWEDELNSGLNVVGGEGLFSVISGELGGFKGDSLEEITDE